MTYIFPKLNIRVDIDKLLDKYKKAIGKDLRNKIIKDLKFTYESRTLIRDILNSLVIRKLKINIYYDFLNYPNIYIYYTSWIVLSFVKNFLDRKTKKIKKEDYQVIITKPVNDVEIYIDGIISVFWINVVVLKNILLIIRGIKNGTSNKRTSKTIR